MEVVNLGRSGLRVTRLCLGTMIFGSQLDQDAAFAVMDRALALGIDFVGEAGRFPPLGVPTFGAGLWGRAPCFGGDRGLPRRAPGYPGYTGATRGGVRDLQPFRRGAGSGAARYNPRGAGIVTGKYRGGQEP